MAAPISTPIRRLVLVVVLIAQAAMFANLLRRPLRVEADNVRYETAGYNLARGKGLSLPNELQPDPEVHEWVCSRHPALCKGDNVPTAMYPPGYQIYIATIYLFSGRSLVALLVSHLVLLLSMFLVFERIAAKQLGRNGYVFVMTIAATYPFLARQAAFVMSDHLHSALLLFSFAVLLMYPPGWWRGLSCGLLLGAATITRPYSFVCIPFVALALLWKPNDAKWRIDPIGLLFGAALPIALWVVRNEIVFGHFIPFSTTRLGTSLYYNKLWWTIGSAYDEANMRAMSEELARVAGGDPLAWGPNRILTSAALDWMKEHPMLMLASLPLRVVRLWISMGTCDHGVSPYWPLLVLYLGLLLALGTAGMWIGRRRHEIVIAASFIVPYWAFLLHTPAEARRTLALRLPMLICGGVAFEVLMASRSGQRFREWIGRTVSVGRPAPETKP
jgi:4-amino-4-deoxy-L-arabinose transferase-like glycosyltransferase